MKSFDQEHRARHEERAREFGEHPFEFRGHIFHVDPNPPYTTTKSVVKVSLLEDAGEIIEVVEDAVLSLILDTPGKKKGDLSSHQVFRDLVRQTDFPVTFSDLTDLMSWLLQEQTGRPPTQAESSSNGAPATGTSSTGSSSEQPDAVSTG